MKSALAVAVGVLAFSFAAEGTCRDLAVRFEGGYDTEPVEVVVAYKRTMLQIMRFQEKKLGASYRNIPYLRFESLFRSNSSESSAELDGMHVSSEGTIYLNKFYEKCSAPLMPEQLDDLKGLLMLGYSRNSEVERCGPANIRAILAHELGHDYTNQFSQSIGRGTWPPKPDNFAGSNTPYKWREVGIRLVSEGVAEYFWKTLVGEKDDFSDSEWKEMTGNPAVSTTYPYITRAGFHFVKPIIDKFGERGLKYLITDCPVVEKLDLTQMPKIQLLIMLTLRAANAPE